MDKVTKMASTKAPVIEEEDEDETLSYFAKLANDD
jgi:hypothetical protein